VEELIPANPKTASTTAMHGRGSRLTVVMDRLAQTWRVLSHTLHRTLLGILAHDCLNLAQSTAYSAIVAIFPALIVAAAVIGLLPDTAPVRFQLAAFFDRVLPPGVSALLDVAFENSPKHAHSLRALVGAGVVSFFGASNVIATLMEGFRRARHLPVHSWTFWQRRRRALELVPLSLVPLAIASLLVVFGHSVTAWIAPILSPYFRESIYAIALLVRWTVALGASVGLIALIYHLGIPQPAGTTDGSPGEHGPEGRPRRMLQSQASILAPHAWIPTLPGAVVATAMWFLTTLAFGWYVTRFANYSEVYGSIGAGIALLFWLYIISLSVLCGAEFNAQFASHVEGQLGAAAISLPTSPDPELSREPGQS
jgi:membrane protein